MSDRPTPETDAAIYPMEQVDVIWPDFARKLERERDEAREALKRIYQASIVAQSLEEDFAEWEKAIEMLLDLIKKEAHYRKQNE